MNMVVKPFELAGARPAGARLAGSRGVEQVNETLWHRGEDISHKGGRKRRRRKGGAQCLANGASERGPL